MGKYHGGDEARWTAEGPLAVQEDLRQSEEQFLHLVSGVTDYAIFLLDAEGYVRTWNAGAERLKGYRPEEIIGQHFSRFYTEDAISRGWPSEELRRASAVGRIEDEGWRLRKDGTRFWANVVITSLRDKSGHLRGFLKITRDLTERRAAEEALRESEERFRLMVEAVQEYAIFMLDPQGRVATWNAGAERLKGYRPHEIIGQHFSRFYSREDIESGKPEWELEIAASTGKYQEEGWRDRKDGSRFWASVVITALRNETGELRGFSKITRDMTERKLAADNVRRVLEEEEARRTAAEENSRVIETQRQQLREINAELEAFSYSVSHDLRAPLRAIQGIANALLEDYGPKFDGVARDYAQRLVDSARRLDALIQDLLAYSRLSRLEITVQPIKLGAIVSEVINGLQQDIIDRRADVAVEGPFPDVMGHRATVVQMVTNLLSNALKFVEPGQHPRVRIRGERRKGWGRLWFEDEGIGVAPEHSERIFNVFERLHGNEAYPGTGIGLAIVKKGAERLGGRCGVDSEDGQGSRFWFELPIKDSSS